MSDNLLTEIKEYDETREGFPGEHWIVLAAGLGVWYLSAKSRSVVGKLPGMAAATALIGRAASGRDGLAKVLRYTPVGGALRWEREAEKPSESRQQHPGERINTLRG